jgi:hypothetical protein
MKHKKIKLCILLLLGSGIGLYAQEAIPAMGGNGLGIGGSVSYSVGQVAYTTNTGSNGSVAQGIQQPYEIYVVTSTEEDESIFVQCTIYPNPASDFLTLKVENYKTEGMTFQLYDVDGKFLESKKLEGNETIIDMQKLVPATYFLKVIQGSKEIRTFKIIKN